MSWYEILIPILTAIIGGAITVIAEKSKQKRKVPNINVYSSLIKTESQKKYFSFYYSKTLHDYFFIARLNVENLSEIAGKLYSVTLTNNDKYDGRDYIFYPASLKDYKEDELLVNYLNTNKFKDDVIFENELTLNPYDKKTVYFVFNVYNRVSRDSISFDLSYSCSGKKHVVKNIKIDITENVFTDHYTFKEINDDRSAYYKEHPDERARKFYKVLSAKK